MLGSSCSPCCAGWYCYSNSCQYYDDADTKPAIWNCGEDQIPPDSIQLQVTYSGAEWCELQYAGAGPGPAQYYSRTYQASTQLNEVLTLYKQPLYEYLWFDTSLITYVKCGYATAGYQTRGANLLPGVNWAAVLPVTNRTGAAGWDGYLNAGVYKRQYDDIGNYVTTCTAGPNGVLSAGGYGGELKSLRGWPRNTTYLCDGGPYTTSNHTLMGLKWTLSRNDTPEVPICTLEVIG